MKKRWIFSSSILFLLLTFAVGLNPAAGDVGSRIPIQGRLTDPGGNPLNGTYSIRFRLYDAAIAGSALCEDTNSVVVTNGLFTSEIWGTCGSSNIKGQQLYLGVKVETNDEMTDRQAIYPVPYAFSLKPGANINGTVSGDAVVHIENAATSGQGLQGYATAASGTTYGVVGRSWSPDGYGGYFASNGGGYALGVEGGLRMVTDAGAAKPITVGDRYRDNAIVAWAKITGGDPGSIQAEFGISAVDHYATGCYKIYLDNNVASASSLIPIAVAEIDTAPVGTGALRIVSVNQVAANIFNVYINNGNGNLVNNDFVFMVTAR